MNSRLGEFIIGVIAFVIILASSHTIADRVTGLAHAVFLPHTAQAPAIPAQPATNSIALEASSTLLQATTTATSTTAQATTTAVAKPKPKTSATAKKSAAPVAAKTAPATSAASATIALPQLIPTETLNAAVRPAVVNIFCRAPTASGMGSITASGVIIDSQGVILTNAHVGQFFLLSQYHDNDFVSCDIRGGNPAHPMYTARVLYVSPQWIRDNSADLTEESPLGTGENDFALLLITGTTDGSPLPSSFPFVLPQPSIPSVDANTSVLIASYPAGFLGGMTLEGNLALVSTISTVDQVLSFTSPPSSIDLLAFKGSIDSQEGSSGGAVVSFTSGKLLGVIVTSTLEGSTADRELRAITYQYIARSFARQAGQSLTSYLNSDLAAEADAFDTNIAPGLSAILFAQIEKN